jgi:hypothetical protein
MELSEQPAGSGVGIEKAGANMRSPSEIRALLDDYRKLAARARADREEAIRQENRGDITLANNRLEMFSERILMLEWVLGENEL